MQEPYEKGVAIHSAPSFAQRTVRCAAKRKQGHERAGYRASKTCNRGADAVIKAEGNTAGCGNASAGWAEQDRKKRGEGKPETFDFLGFTHISGKDRNGNFAVKRHTIGK